LAAVGEWVAQALDPASILAIHPAAAHDSLSAEDLDFQQLMADQGLLSVSARLDAPQPLQTRQPRDAPPKLVFLPEPSGVPLALQAVLQAPLDAQVSAWA
jgi:hypothetical protein